MGFIQGEGREQIIMFPESLDEYVTVDNPVRFIDVFVEQLNLEELGFKRTEPEIEGRPAFNPKDLLRLFIYGYLNRICSSRKLERETRRNIEVMWLIGKLSPGFRTISDFRKENVGAMKNVFRQFTELCRRAGLYGAETVAIDGSKFKAVNSREKNYNEKKLKRLMELTDERIDEYLKRIEEADEEETDEIRPTAEELKGKIEELKKRKGDLGKIQRKLEESGETQLSMTDSEARLMKSRQGTQVCYNAQIAVDSKHKLIAAIDVSNDLTDQRQLSNMSTEAKQTLGVEKLEVITDRGYYNNEEVKKCEEAGITVYMDKPKAARRNGKYTRDEFIYKADKDVYICPAGEELTYLTTEKYRGLKHYTTNKCVSCEVKKECTDSREGRTIKRLLNEDWLERMVKRARDNPQKMKQRKELAEHPFGTIKRNMNQGAFLMKGLDKVKGEFSLTALAYNMKRAIKVAGVETLIQAMT
jgi:transposase